MRHIFLADQRVAAQQSTQTSYYLTDHLGSSTIVLDQSGAVTQTLWYDPFGTLITTSGAPATPYTFTGKEQDQTGLYYFGARYYDPILGRFLTVDPLEQLVLVDKNINAAQLKQRIFDLARYYLPDALLTSAMYPHDLYTPQSLNKYAYALNNPVNYLDPEGLFVFGRRPLENTPGVKPSKDRSGYLSNYLDSHNHEPFHEQGFFEDGLGDNVGFSKERGVFQEADPEKLKAYVFEDEHYEDEIMRQAQKSIEGNAENQRDRYRSCGLGHNNCQDFTDRLREEYQRLQAEDYEDASADPTGRYDEDLLGEE